MRALVAVAHPIFAFNERALKQQALMFQQIGIPTLSSILKMSNEATKHVRHNLDWLREAGIVFEPTLCPYVGSSGENADLRDFLRNDIESFKALMHFFSIYNSVPLEGDFVDDNTGTILDQIEQERWKSTILDTGKDLHIERDRARRMLSSLTRMFSIELREEGGQMHMQYCRINLCRRHQMYALTNMMC